MAKRHFSRCDTTKKDFYTHKHSLNEGKCERHGISKQREAWKKELIAIARRTKGERGLQDLGVNRPPLSVQEGSAWRIALVRAPFLLFLCSNIHHRKLGWRERSISTWGSVLSSHSRLDTLQSITSRAAYHQLLSQQTPVTHNPSKQSRFLPSYPTA